MSSSNKRTCIAAGLAGKCAIEDSKEEKSLGEYEDLSDYEDEPDEPEYESGEDSKECFDYDELHLAYSGEKSPSGKFKLSNVKRMIVKIIESVATIEGRQDDLLYSFYRRLCKQTDFANGDCWIVLLNRSKPSACKEFAPLDKSKVTIMKH
ncbi:hypothetical protein Tco_0841850 [Tanacetum coccineum]|uniref:Uncharacterized protein n=1 Tax=Tanacetum coccineum TaxID=301880 RepID=A0ABQ5AYW1_9ASTR